MELKGKNIVIFSLFRFDSELESTGYTLAKYLAKDNQVYYVDNPYTINDFFRLRKTKYYSTRRKYFGLFSDELIETNQPNLKIVIIPLLLSIHFLKEGWFYRKGLEINEWIIRTKLRYFLKKRKIDDYIFINSFNFHYPEVMKGLSPALEVYHCLDPVKGSFDGKHGVDSEEILVKNADLVICSSRQLYNEKLKQNPATYFVPNAADLDHSRKAIDQTLPISPRLANIKKPIIGYFGVIEGRTNYEMVRSVTERNPDKNFVFVGPVAEGVPDWFTKGDNVFFPGSVPYSEMPAIIKGFDVAIIPFRKDELSATVFPLKLFEYLGAGKPVVATDFNMDLAEFTGDLVAFCPDAESFSEAINKALVDNSEELVAKRIATAVDHTWEKRAEVISDLLMRYYQQKNSKRR
jgi:teichuronic acid biosynthesis glycosyltransferase TuaH